MNKENIRAIGNTLLQGRCYMCAETEGKVCQPPSDSKIIGVWEIFLNENNRAVLNSERAESIENCVIRVNLLPRELVLAS